MKKLILICMASTLLIACGNNGNKSTTPGVEEFKYIVDKFEDVEILRYRVPGFENLTLKQKELVYYLSQAAIEGRDILYDQNGKHNLCIRRTLEAVYLNYDGDRNSNEFVHLTNYLKQVWMGNGIHHHYSADKFTPKFSESFFAEAINSVDTEKLPLLHGETPEMLIKKLTPVIFDPTVLPKRVNQTQGEDLITTSANNYYEGVTQAEAEGFYDAMKDPDDNTPIAYGLNSKLVKEDGVIKEKVYKVGGLYSPAIERIVHWLKKASEVAENTQQKAVIDSLIEFYTTGDLKTYDDYSIKWVQDVHSLVDFVNGFTESYGDPLGMKASWESIVNFKNTEATKRTEVISSNAQWFEDHSPIEPRFRKEKVKGVSAKVITAAMLGGDCYPASPLGINLPNSNWIRRDYGSKSVTIENIAEAYNRASLGNGFAEEFMWSNVEREQAKKYSALTDNLHTDLHECLGHGSGKLLPGVDPDALKAYGSPIEEARADLFGLYFMADPIMVKLGLLPDTEAYKAQYYQYVMNGLMTQLVRIQPGKDIEQAHMRNRQLIASWVYEKGNPDNVIELAVKDGKHYVKINDYEKLQGLFGQLLAEIQEIKSTGDFDGARHLIETYAVKVNQPLHTEILERYKKLNLTPYRGFINPSYTPVTDKKGKITDICINYEEDYLKQNIRYSQEFSTLPIYN
ncbi:dihydrofolate reductase [Paludibacter sp. 221]|uniref:dipeptidyl-peptidase 3 family protein n=1 Tax=Paludibacter sp. 221 TaxID=2302939 RepID=UPI0013D3CF74|nr:dihydrofolate reductase [Paludibacter sp. 221]NDV47236.1 dihydrofolate reductase [Paludibacter sp. 221]